MQPRGIFPFADDLLYNYKFMNELILKRIKILELVSTVLATLAYPIALLISNGNNRILVILLIGGLGLILQPYIFYLYKRINQSEVFKQKRFWPMTMGLLFISFLIITKKLL